MEKLYFLLFSSHFDRDKGIDQGRLRLCNLTAGHISIWVASSSVSTKQGIEGFHQRGGYIPPEYRTKDLRHWNVETRPVDLTHVKGVAGNFYRILPYQVETDRGGRRSDFGIHLDANVPGSMGCIVMSEHRFVSFEQKMERMRELGILRLPLFVTYS